MSGAQLRVQIAERVERGVCSKCNAMVFSDQERQGDGKGNYIHAKCPSDVGGSGGLNLELEVEVVDGRDLLEVYKYRPGPKVYVTFHVGDENETSPRELPELYRTDSVAPVKYPRFRSRAWKRKFKLDESVLFADGQSLVLRIYETSLGGGAAQMGQVAIKLLDMSERGNEEEYEVVENPEMRRGTSGRPRMGGFMRVKTKLVGVPRYNNNNVGTLMPTRKPAAGGAPAQVVQSSKQMGRVLKTMEFEALRKITSIAEELSSKGFTIHPPKVAVVGPQSSGKSTLFNVILRGVGSKARFPEGVGTCTKVPTILQLRRKNQHEVQVGTNLDLKTLIDPTEQSVTDAIKMTQTSILRSAFKDYREEGDEGYQKYDEVKFCSNAVTVIASSPDIYSEIVIVDLPGLISMGPGQQDISDMIRGQISSDNTLIVSVGKGDNDDQNDQGLGLLETIDPDKKRTMRVYTFWGNTTEARQEEIKTQIRREGDAEKKAHVVHLERDKVTKELHPATVQDVPPDCQGDSELVTRLASRLSQLVRHTAPDMRKQFQDEKRRIEKRLGEIGSAPTDNGYTAMIEELSTLLKALDKIEEGLAKKAGVDKIVYELGRSLKEMSGDHLKEVDNDFWQLNKAEPAGFQGRDALAKWVGMTLDRWIEPLTKYVSQIEEFVLQLKEKTMSDLKTAHAKKKEKHPDWRGWDPELIPAIEAKWEVMAKNIAAHLDEVFLSPDDGKLARLKKGPPMRQVFNKDMFEEPSALMVLASYKRKMCTETAGSEREDDPATAGVLARILEENRVEYLDGLKQLRVAKSRTGSDLPAEDIAATENFAYVPTVDDIIRCENEGCCLKLSQCQCPNKGQGSVFPDELGWILKVRGRIHINARDWIGHAGGGGSTSGSLGSVSAEALEIGGSVVNSHFEVFKNSLRNPEMQRYFNPDPYKDERETITYRLKKIEQALDAVRDLEH
mmetsp:Transcript_35170/g.68943  ORF Transcript_35170/g.68943 Transcript_35170/m.68943 type:complete len:955 (-) Transcript_35170:549-3413(-)